MDLPSQLRAELLAQSLPPPSASFLASLCTAPRPLASLVATARARLLACDLAAPTAAALLDVALLSALPAVAPVAPVDARLPRDVYLQVLDVEDLARSRWDQVEDLEAVARGERSRGRQVVRVAAEDDGQSAVAASSSVSAAAATAAPAAGPNATHRLVLQDCQGKRVYAVELRRIDRIGVGKTNIGEKLLLRAGTVVARGTLLLTPDKCVPLGGKIDVWHDAWVEGRLARLKEAVGGHA